MVVKKIKQSVDQNLNKIAYKVNYDSITYEELWNKANKYAQLLIRQGTSPVVLYGSKDTDIFISIIACLIANRAYVPIGLSTPLNRIEKIVQLTNSDLIITNENICVDNVTCSKLEGLKQFESNEINEIQNDIAYIIFTSGSTGDPKGVPISKDNLNNFINWISNTKPLSEYKSINLLNQVSFSFDVSVADIYYSLCNGHTLVAFDGDVKEEYEKIFDLFGKNNINLAVMTPTFMKLCLLNDKFNEKNYSDFKCAYICGEQLEIKLVRKIYERFPHLKVVNAYGPTEATCTVSEILITKDMLDNEELLPVGEIETFATEICIDNDEIILKGKSVFSGYLNKCVGGYYSEDNINCYRTGDIGFFKDGKLYCKGRKDSQIKYKGYRIELNDIEINLSKIPGVKECAVVAKYNEEKSVKTIKAFVVVENDKYNNEYVKKELRALIPGFMMPKSIKIIDKLPINQNGKIDRKALSEV